MKQLIVYVIGMALIIAAYFIDGFISWGIAIVGVILTYVANFLSDKEVVGETDKTILALLINASYSDKHCSKEEKKYIEDYVKRRGLSKKQVEAVAKYAKDPTKWKFSSDEEQKMRIISEVVGLIKADGVVTDEEKEYLGNVAEVLDVDKDKALALLS